MTPDTFAFIDDLTRSAHGRGLELLVEVHSYYQDQIDIAAAHDGCIERSISHRGSDILFDPRGVRKQAPDRKPQAPDGDGPAERPRK